MRVDVNGTSLWFDVEGAGLVPNGPAMQERPTLLLIHGGPGGYDHSYFKPWFSRFADVAQVVYLDLRNHGRSARHDPARWTLEVCADDVRAFCDALGIVRPVVLGHSMGGFVTLLVGARHPALAAGLILVSTCARWDADRLVAGFGRVAGAEVAELARRDFGGEAVTDAESARVAAAFGPTVPTDEVLGRRVSNPDIGGPGMDLVRSLDIVDQVGRIACPALVCVGELDPVTPVDAAEELAGALARGVGRLEVIDGAGHFPWLDAPERCDALIRAFVTEVAGSDRVAPGSS
jgi:pimeloyl-ACP methyl ester carboxylesterase